MKLKRKSDIENLSDLEQQDASISFTSRFLQANNITISEKTISFIVF